jgi:biopolymer transport protein ExbD
MVCILWDENSCSKDCRRGIGMRRWDDGESARARIEIIPMIDVMMFLLVFFVLISINVIPALGLKTALPSSHAPEKLDIRKHVVITLARDGTIALDGQITTLAQLGDLLTQKRALNPDMDITINGDRGVVLQHLVDVFDVLKAKGFNDVAIATKRPS